MALGKLIGVDLKYVIDKLREPPLYYDTLPVCGIEDCEQTSAYFCHLGEYWDMGDQRHFWDTFRCIRHPPEHRELIYHEISRYTYTRRVTHQPLETKIHRSSIWQRIKSWMPF